MDKKNKIPQKSAYQEDLQRTATLTKEQIDNQYIMEDGNPIRVPYRMVRQITLTGIRPAGAFSDQEHAARLQYNLLLNPAILKARVHYIKSSIIIIYNPKDTDNLKEKIDTDEIKHLLYEQNVEIDDNSIKDEPYDYYKYFYSYAFKSPSVKEHSPYGYTLQEWEGMKPEWEEKVKKYTKKKERIQKQFQESYLNEHPELAEDFGLSITDTKTKREKKSKLHKP